jgi:hypothetical protein
MESYHVNIPIARASDAKISNLVASVNNLLIAFFLNTKIAVSSNIVPAVVMLVADRTSGEIWIAVVRNSIRIDSTEIAIAYTKTIQDLPINNAEFNYKYLISYSL